MALAGLRLRGGLLAGVAWLALSSGLSAAETTQYTYDALGRVVSAIDASGRKVVYTYDGTGNRTRVSNGAEFQEIVPTAWSASSNAGTTGLTVAGMKDGDLTSLASIHVTSSTANAAITADLGSVKNVNHIDVAAPFGNALNTTPADLNDVALEYSVDGTTWKPAATLAGIGPGAPRSVALGGVSLRYLRLRRTVTGRVALGDLRLFSAAVANSPLIAEPDSLTSTGAGTTFDPRANDRDLDGYAFTITAAEDPPHGTVAINAGASITYTPDAGYAGADSFSYTIADGHNGTATARVTVLVRPSANHSPLGVEDRYTVSDRASAIVDGVNVLRPLANDLDPDGDLLTITGVTSAPAHGTASVVGGGVIEYVPTTGYSGTDTLTYALSDGRGGSSSAVVYLTLANSAPIAKADTRTIQKGQAVTLDPRLNDFDPNGDTLTVSAITQPGLGSAVLNSDQTITYTPPVTALSSTSLTYTLGDGRGGSATGRVNILSSTNTKPVAIADDLAGTGTLTFDPRLNDSDPESDPLTIVAVGAPASGGTVSVNPTGTAITYTPPSGYTGANSFTYTIADDEGATATASVAINAVNIEYLVVAGGGGGGWPYNGPGGGGGGGGVVTGSTALALASLSVTVGAGGAYGEDPNWRGVDGGASSLGSVATATGGGGGGTASHSGRSGGSGGGYGGAGTSGQGNNGGGYGGGGGGATVAGTAVVGNNGGKGGAGLVSSLSGAAVVYGSGGGGGGTETIVAGEPGPGGGKASGYPGDPVPNRGGGGGGGYIAGEEDYRTGTNGGSGIVIARYRGAPKASGGTITQGGGYTIHTFTAGGTFQLTSLNGAPSASNDSISLWPDAALTFDPRANDTDPNGDALSVVSVSAPSHGAAKIALGGAAITYTPAAGYAGTDSFTYTVSDGAGLLATASVSVTVQQSGVMQYLVVAAGGGGGTSTGSAGLGAGGGGGGGVLTGYAPMTSGAKSVTVGAGGAGASSSNASAPGSAGGGSSIASVASTTGGGGGGSRFALPTAGGSGGGGSDAAGAAGLLAQGTDGGAGVASRNGGGGGGATTRGASIVYADDLGPGGGGLTSTISGTAVVYGSGGGGGGGGSGCTAGPGGAGAGNGGTSQSGAYAGGPATANRGGGGGGAASCNNITGNGGNGGSGVVIIRYAGTPVATGGTITQVGGYTIHTFTVSGTFTVP